MPGCLSTLDVVPVRSEAEGDTAAVERVVRFAPHFFCDSGQANA